uniref:acylaminoacyl-peptidase n=1 Tax=Neospora caninum (strain Liverpool) TaxID=572307 RepID=A0A0F7UKP8_NEOCL|nr:TPA: Peptidase, S9A/B/C family, catalytic domain protein, related [Neospora caninum Liverpool]
MHCTMGGSGCPQPAAGDQTKRLREAFSVCSESVIQCLSARIAATKSSDPSQDAIVVLGQQKVLNERRVVGMTARVPNCDLLTAWPLGLPSALTVLSPSAHFFASVVEATPPNAKKKPRPSFPQASAADYRIELFGRGPVHTGPVVTVSAPRDTKPWNSSVGGGVFCPEREELFVYVAEASKRDDNDASSGSTSDGTGETSDGDSLDTYEFKTHWGEQLVGHRRGRLVLTDFKRRTAQLLKPPKKETACGQPRFLSDGSGVVCSNWELDPYCLGLIYCMNRASKVLLAQLPSSTSEEGKAGEKADEETKESTVECEWIQISGDEDFAAWSPTVLHTRDGSDPNTQRIAFLCLEKDKPETLPHMCAPRIKAVTLRRKNACSSWEVVERQTLAQAVSVPPQSESLFSRQSVPYTGIYTDRLGPWVHNDFLFLNTFVGARRTVVVVDAHGGGCVGELCLEEEALRAKPCAASKVEASCPPGSILLHDVTSDWLLLESSSARHIPRLMLAKLLLSPSGAQSPQSGRGFHIRVAGSVSLGGPSDPQRLLPWSPFARLTTHLERLEVRYLSDNRHILLRWKESPRRDGKRALAVVLHGGPHSVWANIFSAEAVYLTFLGFDVLAVNYRGSLGFGQAELLSLLGNVGRQDVDDVKQAVTDFIDSDPEAYSPARAVVVGGSHGGFLTCHLIGQFPDMFAAASTRNPVTNLASMVVESDIPDWCAAEALRERLNPSFVLSETDVVALYKASPVAYARHVKTPLLLGIGGADLRVPACQGIAFHKMLLGQGSPTRLLFYPEEDHRIDRPSCSEDYWVNTALWFAGYTGTLEALKEDVLPAAPH